MNAKKQIIILIIAVAVTFTIGLIVYFIFRAPKTTISPTTLTNISASPMTKPVLDATNQNILYYNMTNTKDLAFYQYNLSSKKEQKISQNIDVPDNILWSPKRDKIILKVIYDKYVFEKVDSIFKDSSIEDKQETTWFYDLNTNNVRQLDLNIQSIIWINNNQIIYYLYNPSNKINAIFIANADGSNAEKLKDLDFSENINLGLLSSDSIYYSPTLFENGVNNIYSLNIKTKQTNLIIKNQPDSNILAVSNNNHILYQTFNAKSGDYTVSLMDTDGKNKNNLNLKASNAKAVFSTDGNFAIIALREKNKTTDTFYKIDTKTKRIEKLDYNNELLIDAKNLNLSSDNKIFYFTSNDLLYKLENF